MKIILFWVALSVAFAQSSKLLLHTTLDDAASITSPLRGTGLGAVVVTSPENDFVPAKFGNGARFDARGEFARFPQIHGRTQNVEIDEGTVDFWYRPGYSHDATDCSNKGQCEYMFFQTARRKIVSSKTRPTAGSLEIGKHNRANGHALMIIYWEPDSTDPNNVPIRWESTVQMPGYKWSANEWVNLRVTWDWTVPPGVRNIHAYMNGLELDVIGRDPGDPPHTGPKRTIPESPMEHIHIGGQPADGGGGWLTNGVVDEVKIYDAPVPASTPAR